MTLPPGDGAYLRNSLREALPDPRAIFDNWNGSLSMSFRMGVEGLLTRVFKIEAPVEAVYAFITDYKYSLPRMPDVEKLQQFTDNRYRLFYSAEVVAGYHMKVIFDIRPEPVADYQIRIVPLPISQDELKKICRAHGETFFTGKFSGGAKFKQVGRVCEVDYRALLEIEVEVPQFLRLLPHRALTRLGNGVMSFKINHISDSMAHLLPVGYRDWSRENQDLIKALLEARQSSSNQPLN